MKRYDIESEDPGCVTIRTECPDGIWVDADEALLEIARLKKIIAEQDALLSEAAEIVSVHGLIHRSHHAHDLADRIRRRAEVEPDSAKEDA